MCDCSPYHQENLEVVTVPKDGYKLTVESRRGKWQGMTVFVKFFEGGVLACHV